MRLTSITANRHIFEGRVNGKPLRLLLNFDSGRSLRLAVAGDGERMIIDDEPLDEPFDMAEAGAIDIADVTEALRADLHGADVENIRALVWNGSRVGVQLVLATGEAFHVWVDGDELHWGDGRALISHEWLDGIAPTPNEGVNLLHRRMSFFVHHRYGASEREPPPSIFPALLDELEERLDDEEHTSVSVVHESEWGLGFYRGGNVTFENVEGDGEPRHMQGVSREKAIEMMLALSKGDLAALEREPWQQGY